MAMPTLNKATFRCAAVDLDISDVHGKDIIVDVQMLS